MRSNLPSIGGENTGIGFLLLIGENKLFIHRHNDPVLKMRCVFFTLMLGATVACSQKQAEKADSNIFLDGQPLAEVTDKKLKEASGLAASANNPGMLWTHNDSGNGAAVFLIDKKLDVKLTCKLGKVKNRDWEDITVGPGPEPGKSYIYVADIGDNAARYPYKMIYRFEEPVLDPAKSEMTITKFDTITFQLEGEVKDTEALMINPQNKNIYIISKREDPVYLYELAYPHSTKDTLTASNLTALPYSHIVAADFSADGREVIMKNYKNVYYWKVDNRPLAEVMKGRPYILIYKEEPQGEAVTFARDGAGYFTISEKVSGEKSYLYFYPRKNK
jgi:hypothetical protein